MNVASPLTLPCGATVKNRLMKSAMSEALGTNDNRVTPALATLYARWARGGIGLLVTGNVMVDRRALGEPGNVVLEDDRDSSALAAWAAAGSAHGTGMWMQLNHPGRQSPRGLNRENIAPSAVPWEASVATYFAEPRAMTGAEIDDTIARFGRAAGLAKAAGFSGVQIHGAHGYLVSQFLSPRTNQRTDRWGGSTENRLRFALAVYAAIRDAVGAAFPVGIKLNSADFQKGGFGEDDAIGAVEALSAAGMDLIEISGGTYEAPAMTGIKESTRKREAYFLDFAEKVRTRVNTPLAVTGGFRSRAGVDQALAAAVDFVGLARSVALDPDFPNAILSDSGAVSKVKPVTTGLRIVDKQAVMEVLFYSRQLHRMGRGEEPRPDENPLFALGSALLTQGIRTVGTRLRA